MHTFFTFTADFTPWQQHRVDAACQAFLSIIEPNFDVEPLDLDGTRVGCFYKLTTAEARQRLIVFFTALTSEVPAEHPHNGARIQDPQHDAAISRDRLAEVTR